MFKHVTKLGGIYYKVLDITKLKFHLYELTIIVDNLDKSIKKEYREESKKHEIKPKNYPDLKGHVDRY
jgi:hypothetical protein